MIQEQINFLEKFEVYLANRGFRVMKYSHDVKAYSKVKLSCGLPVTFAFKWRCWKPGSSVIIQMSIGPLNLEQSLPVALLMDYEELGERIVDSVIRILIENIARDVINEFKKIEQPCHP